MAGLRGWRFQVPARRPIRPVDEVAEKPHRLSLLWGFGCPILQSEPREESAGTMIRVLVERLRQDDEGRARLAQQTHQLSSEIIAVVRNIWIESEIIGWIGRVRRR